MNFVHFVYKNQLVLEKMLRYLQKNGKTEIVLK